MSVADWRGAKMTVIAATALLSLSACSAGVVDSQDVEDQIVEELGPRLVEAPEDVACPKPLEAKVDAVLTCTVDVRGESVDVKVRVSSVEGDTVTFDMETEEAAAEAEPKPK